MRAVEPSSAKSVLLGGGVAANQLLRTTLADKLKRELPGVVYHQPEMSFCLDNAVMAGVAAYYIAQGQDLAQYSWSKIEANSNLSI